MHVFTAEPENKSHDKVVLFQGYAFVPKGDDEALKEAVYRRGPLAVSLDAGHRSFRFYSHGQRCSSLSVCTCSGQCSCPGCILL